MPNIYHNCPLTQTQQIIIDAYVVETNTSSAHNNPQNESKHIKTFRCSDSNPIIARQKAFKRLLIEEKKLTEQCDKSNEMEPDMGLKLYLEYHDNNDEVREEPPTKHRLYLGDYILLGTKSESIPVIRN